MSEPWQRSREERADRSFMTSALAELIAAATVMLASMVWSPEALPMAERLAAAVNRVTELTEKMDPVVLARSVARVGAVGSQAVRAQRALSGPLAEGLTDAITSILVEFETGGAG